MKTYLVKILFIFFIVMNFPSFLFGQPKNKTQETFSVVSYNVENLMDTIRNPSINDADFTPTGSMKWTSKRYEWKVKSLSKVLRSIVAPELPDVVGLIEIENASVLQDLITADSLRAANYAFVHEESPDERGIDVGFLYRKDRFQYISHKQIPVALPDTSDKTRDILYVQGKTTTGEFLHFYVNHWPSRREGEQESEKNRIAAATTLRQEVDLILSKSPDAKIIIMGDMNDEPTNKSLTDVLLATNNQKSKNTKELYNLFFDKKIAGEGTYFYKKQWNMLDNLVVSQSLLQTKKGYRCKFDSGKIFKPSWLLYKNDKTGDLSPRRTYTGTNYRGGYSDHLPVYLILTNGK